jgi:hypothetical protein
MTSLNTLIALAFHRETNIMEKISYTPIFVAWTGFSIPYHSLYHY